MSISKISPADDDITEVEALPQPQHNPKIGFFVYLLSFLAVVGGFLFGYDTGIVSSAMMYLPHYKGMIPMNSLWKELIVSITPGMAAVGAVLAGPASDRLGRKKVILASSFVFTVGGVVCAVAFEKICLLVGRILLGLAIGFASMVVPIYVGEASPAYIRGRLVTAFQLMITFGLFASNAIAGGFSYIDPENIGWRLMLAFASLPSLLQLIGFLFMPESPRYLFGTGDVENVTKTLERIYAGDEEWINYELREIEISHNLERKAKAQVGDQLVIWRMLTTPHVRRALLIGCALQMFQQLCGINTIMYYTATIIKSAGVEDIHNTIWIAVGISSINFLATFFPLALVERFGRRFLLLLSVAGVIIALILMGVAFLLINQDSMRSEVNFDVKETELALRCRKYDNCDFCVTDEACGFCKRADGTAKKGWCLPVDEDEPSHSTQGVCGIGHDPKIYEYHSDYCVTKYTAMPIAVMVFYLTSFAVGFAPLAWVLNAEFYPLWARGTGCALSTCVNWLFNLLISLTFLTLSQAVTKYGAFFIYAGITCVAFVFIAYFVPETKGISIEEVELLFMRAAGRRRTLTMRGIEGHHIERKRTETLLRIEEEKRAQEEARRREANAAAGVEPEVTETTTGEKF